MCEGLHVGNLTPKLCCLRDRGGRGGGDRWSGGHHASTQVDVEVVKEVAVEPAAEWVKPIMRSLVKGGRSGGDAWRPTRDLRQLMDCLQTWKTRETVDDVVKEGIPITHE